MSQQEEKQPEVQQEPRDDFMFEYIVSKAEDRKIMLSHMFEQVSCKYWNLIKTQPSSDRTQNVIDKAQYKSLMSRIYKVLLPLYREQEVSAEIDQEWISDSKGQENMSQNLFMKLMFRIAHQWATHIDQEEYCEILNKIYDRITVMKIIRGDGSVETVLPSLKIDLFQEDKTLDLDEEDEWIECAQDESTNSLFDYKYEEDPNDLSQKMFKRRKNDDPLLAQDDRGIFLSVREPFLYKEEVRYFDDISKDAVNPPGSEDISFFVFADIEDIYPMGYPTEQYIAQIKNDVCQAFAKLKEDKKRALAAMKRELFEGGAAMLQADRNKDIVDKDPGLLEEKNVVIDQPFVMHQSGYDVKIKTFASVKDTVYNQFRQIFRDSTQLNIRPHFDFPRMAILNGKVDKGRIGKEFEHTSQVNKLMYNPTLERRLNYKKCSCIFESGQESRIVNVNYLIVDPVYETCYRSDVSRVETSAKMAIKPNEEFVKEEDYCNVTTSFRDMITIMLVKKFETFFTYRLQEDDEVVIQKAEKTYELEKQRKAAARLVETLADKQLKETYDDKNDLKLMKGPFYNLMSKEGPTEDDFVNCGTQDLIDSANKEAMSILIIGKPRSGKTTLAKNLAQRLDLVRVSVDEWINGLFAKIKDREENPPEDEEEEEEEPPVDPEDSQAEPVEKKPKKWLTDLEESVRDKLMAGSTPNINEINEILVEFVSRPICQTKGFVLDLDMIYENQYSWGQRLYENFINKGQNFTHIVELEATDEEIKLRTSNLRLDIDDGIVYSKWERIERAKPKMIQNEDGEWEEEEPKDPEDEDYVKPLIEDELVTRVCDEIPNVLRQIEKYMLTERQDEILDQQIILTMHDSCYIKMDIGGFLPDELTDAIAFRLKPKHAEPLRPIARIIEGGAGDFKQLLTMRPEEEEDDENVLPYTWSLWRTQDPVELLKGRVEEGSPEWACHYANNVFVFTTEENMNEFANDPKKFLNKPPEMPHDFRVLMLGPKGAGVHTQAKALEEFYGWRVVDYLEVVQTKLREILSQPEKLPNNVVQPANVEMSEEEIQKLEDLRRRCEVNLSQDELQDIKDGKPFPSWKFLPWICEYLNVQLQQRPPPPPGEEEVVDPDEMTEEERAAYLKEKKKKDAEEAKRLKEEAEALKAKQERAERRAAAIEAGQDLAELGLEESDDEPKIDDLPIDQLIVAKDEAGNIPRIGQFILVGFPQTEVHVEKLKEYGLDFDRILYLNDPGNEEKELEPGVAIANRIPLPDEVKYDWEAENEKAQKQLGVVSEGFGEEKVIEVDCSGSIEEVFINIRTKMDPFFCRIDAEENYQQPDDIDNDEDDPNPKFLPRGDFGTFCPVTYVKDNFLVKGSTEPECTVTHHGKTFNFASENEKAEFEFDPSKYLIAQNGKATLPLQAPAPKIMICGQKGAGTSTLVRMLCDKFKLEEFELQAEYLKALKEEKEQRKRLRRLNRGFKPPEEVEEGEEPEPDPEIEEDPEEYDAIEYKASVIQRILDANKGLVIDGTWRISEDVPEITEDPPLWELLTAARRMPEVLVVLECKIENTFKRCIDKDAIKVKFDELMDAREKKREEDRVRDRAEKLAELKEDEEKTPEEIEEEMKEWDANREEEDEAADEDDPEKPDLEEMVKAEEEKLTEMHEADFTQYETLDEDLKGKVNVHRLKSDISAEYVFIKMLDKLKDHLQFRHDLIEREQVRILAPKEVPYYEKSYTYKHSKFGENSPITPYNPIKTKNFAVLYRERVYFCSNANEQKAFKLEPSKYTKGVEAVPNDLLIKPRACVLGLPKSGKSELCQKISELTGAVHLKIEEIAEYFMDRDSEFSVKLRDRTKENGLELLKIQLVQMVKKRIQMLDCQKNGWVLEGFPETREQAELLAEKGIKPTNVFMVNIPYMEVFKRTEPYQIEEFACDRRVLSARMKLLQKSLPETAFFYNKFYNSVTNIDGMKSKWFVQDIAIKAIEKNLKARLEFAREYFFNESEKRPCIVENLNIDRCFFKKSLSQYGYFCPVSWKVHKKFINCVHRPENCVLYKHMFYYFATTSERDMFVQNPKKFTEKVIFSNKRNCPQRLRGHKSAELVAQEKALLGFCPVLLKESEKVQKGNQLLIVQFKDNRFIMSSEEAAVKFYQNPQRYANVQLPVKMPPQVDPVTLHFMQKQEDSTGFMQQALGSVVTRGLREVGDNRLKYPKLSIKETTLKLFALFLKANNPANTDYMKEKYVQKIRAFVEKCEVPEELHDLSQEKAKKQAKGRWPQFKENYYNSLGAKYDVILKEVDKEKVDGFQHYVK